MNIPDFSTKLLIKMRILSIAFLLSIISVDGFAQKRPISIEINPFLRYDKYEEFYAWESVVSGKNFVKPESLSYGLNLNLKKEVNNDCGIYVGLGYYKYSFSKIRRRNSRGTGDDRLISFPSPLFIFYFSDRYWYNTLSFNIGGEKTFKLKNNYLLAVGAGLTNYYTFSQYYHLTSNPEGSEDYKKRNKQNFGLTAGLEIGLLKKYRQFSIGPKLQVAMFSTWKTDETFPNETNTGSRNKWLDGIGIGISCNYTFKKNK